MLVNKNLLTYINEDEYLIDVVQSQMSNHLMKSRGNVIVTNRYREDIKIDIGEYPHPSSMLPGIYTYIWDLNRDIALMDILRYHIRDMRSDEKKLLFKLCEVNDFDTQNISSLSRVDQIRIELNMKKREIDNIIYDIEYKMNILREHYILDKSIDMISEEMDIPIYEIKSILKQYAAHKITSQHNQIPKHIMTSKMILNHTELILSMFSEGYYTKSLYEMYNQICLYDNDFSFVSIRCFEDFMRNHMGLQFKHMKTLRKDIDKISTKNIQNVVSMVVIKL